MPDPNFYLAGLCQNAGYRTINPDNFNAFNIVLIFDEAQLSYGDYALWLGLIKTQSCSLSGPRICLFSSYGSPQTGHSDYPLGSTPVMLGPAQRISILPSAIPNSPRISLFYNKREYDGVVERRCANPSASFRIDIASRDYIFTITAGHPGAVRALLDYIFTVCGTENFRFTFTADLQGQYRHIDLTLRTKKSVSSRRIWF